MWPNISPSGEVLCCLADAISTRTPVALMLLIPLNRVDRPPPGGVGQFQIPFRMGVSALLVAALLNQSPSAALAIESGSKLAAACTEQPARTPPQPASEVKAGTSGRPRDVYEDILDVSVSVFKTSVGTAIPLGVVSVLANSRADTIKAQLLADISAEYTGKLPKDLVNIDRAQSRAATEKLHQLTVEGRWNEDKTILRVTAFFIQGKIKHAPSSILDPRSGLDFDLRFGAGAAEPLVLCVVMGTTILDKRDVSDLVLDGVQIVGGAEVCLRLPAITPRPVPPLLRECRICHHICRLSATCFLA